MPNELGLGLRWSGVPFGDEGEDRGWDEVGPIGSGGDTLPDFGGRDLIEGVIHGEMVDSGGEVEGRGEGALPRSDEEFELFELGSDRRVVSVVPVEDALGGVAPAEKSEAGVFSVEGAAFTGDFEEEAAFGDSDGESGFVRGGGGEHFKALLEGDLLVELVGKGFGHNKKHLFRLKRIEGGLCEGEVGAGGGMEGSGEDTEAVRSEGSFAQKSHVSRW